MVIAILRSYVFLLTLMHVFYLSTTFRTAPFALKCKTLLFQISNTFSFFSAHLGVWTTHLPFEPIPADE